MRKLTARVGYNVGNPGFFTASGWNVDDLRISDSACP